MFCVLLSFRPQSSAKGHQLFSRLFLLLMNESFIYFLMVQFHIQMFRFQICSAVYGNFSMGSSQEPGLIRRKSKSRRDCSCFLEQPFQKHFRGLDLDCQIFGEKLKFFNSFKSFQKNFSREFFH